MTLQSPVAFAVLVFAVVAIGCVFSAAFRGWLIAVLAWPSVKFRWFLCGLVLGFAVGVVGVGRMVAGVG